MPHPAYYISTLGGTLQHTVEIMHPHSVDVGAAYIRIWRSEYGAVGPGQSSGPFYDKNGTPYRAGKVPQRGPS